MRFLLSGIFKRIPFLNNYWVSYLEKNDFKHYDMISKKYKIIPFGCYCMPRVITTINRFKPTKKYGEESYPFDLCFSVFSLNTSLLSSGFKDFFDDIEFDNSKYCYVNEKYRMKFIHDNLSIEEFKIRYKKRIENLYNSIKDETKHVYFLIASFEPVLDSEIKAFIDEINKYRSKNTYSIILINQSDKKINYEYENLYVIDLTGDKIYKKLDRNGLWVEKLKSMRKINARIFNHKIVSKLSKIIKV